MVGGVEQRTERLRGEIGAPACAQILARPAQLAREVGDDGLDLKDQMEESFQPELADVVRLVALLHEPDGQQVARVFGIRP